MTQRAGSCDTASGGHGQTMSGWKIATSAAASLRSQARVSRWTISSISRSTLIATGKRGGRTRLPGRPRTSLERDPEPELELPRVAGALLDSTVEVEHEVGHRGLLRVLGVEQVEAFDRRLDDDAADLKRPRETQVERRELVVLVPQVPARDRAVLVDPVLGNRGRDSGGVDIQRLVRPVGVAGVEVDVERSDPEEVGVDPVALVAVGVAPLLGELRGRIRPVLVDQGVSEGE